MSNTQIEVVQLGVRKYVGIALTSPLKCVKGISEVQQLFKERKDEIQNNVDKSTYVCVHFANEVLFTYIYCMEVTELQQIPEGMIGFEVPSNQYVKVLSNGEEPYGLIHSFLRENGMESNLNSVSFEVFQFGEEESKYKAEILVPIC